MKLSSSPASGALSEGLDLADFDLSDFGPDLGVDLDPDFADFDSDLYDLVPDFGGGGDFEPDLPDLLADFDADLALAAAYDGGAPQLFSHFGGDLEEDLMDFTIDLTLLLLSVFPLDLQDFSTSFTVWVLQLLPDFSVLCTDFVLLDLTSSSATDSGGPPSLLSEDGGHELALLEAA